MQTISPTDLTNVTGGAAVTECSPANPTGAQPQQSLTAMRNPDGSQVSTPKQYNEAIKSPLQRANESVDRAMAPWETFNGIFGGMAADAPRPGRF